MYVHHVIGAKGGTGKTLLTTLLADYLTDTGAAVELFDASLHHHSLARFHAQPATAFMRPTPEWKFKVDFHSIIDAHSAIVDGAQPNKHVLVDVSSHVFLALAHTIPFEILVPAFHNFGFRTVFHHIIPGGWNQRQTEEELAYLIHEVPEPAQFIVWLNHHHGPVRAPLENLAPRNLHDRILAIAELPRLANHQLQALHHILAEGSSLGQTAANAKHSNHIAASEIWPQFKSQIATAIATVPPPSLPTKEATQATASGEAPHGSHAT